jgi:hypothetical protein
MGMALDLFLVTAFPAAVFFGFAAWRGERLERTGWMSRTPEPAPTGKQQIAGAG